jgi:hypothetical protein
MLNPIDVDERWVKRWAEIWVQTYRDKGVVAADTWLNRFLAKHPILRRRVRIHIKNRYSSRKQ